MAVAGKLLLPCRVQRPRTSVVQYVEFQYILSIFMQVYGI